MILSVINDLYPNNYAFVKHIVQEIQPIIESFFMIYNQLQSIGSPPANTNAKKHVLQFR